MRRPTSLPEAPATGIAASDDDHAALRCRTRVAFLTDIVTPYMAVLFEAMDHGCELSVIFCSRIGTRGMDWRLELPFRHEVVEGLTIRRRTPDATDFYLSPRIFAALQRARPEAIISGGFSFPSLYAAIYGASRGIPLLIHSDGTATSEAQLGPHNALARRLLRRLAWGAVANSQPAATRFAEIGFAGDRIFLAPHVTQLEPLWEVAGQRQISADGALRVLFVGRLIPRKGCDGLLRACAEARSNGLAMELIVVGTGPEEVRLRALAEDLAVPVRWKGFVDQPGLARVYAEADVFAFPTLDDPFGIVVLEAAAAGLPLIASPHGGATADLVRDGVNGYVVEPTDTKAMSSALARLATDPTLRSRMGYAAHNATRSRTPAASASGYLRAVQTALLGSSDSKVRKQT
jgi:glycosyltransferase involved in cell wall biosynthesis